MMASGKPKVCLSMCVRVWVSGWVGGYDGSPPPRNNTAYILISSSFRLVSSMYLYINKKNQISIADYGDE
jgi:hypothetical protein